MAGILVLLGVSWILLYTIEKRSLLALGFLPLAHRGIQFLKGFLFSAVLCALVQLSLALIGSFDWIINEEANANLVLTSFWYDFKSILTEELAFRGALLYILIKKLGEKKAIYLSAIGFGIYHWFSMGVFGSLVPMIIIFLGTGMMGYAWADAFARGKSILLPIGFHFGWNLVVNTVFSTGPLGEVLFLRDGGVEVTGMLSLLNFSLALFIGPILTIIYVKLFIKNK